MYTLPDYDEIVAEEVDEWLETIDDGVEEAAFTTDYNSREEGWQVIGVFRYGDGREVTCTEVYDVGNPVFMHLYRDITRGVSEGLGGDVSVEVTDLYRW